MKERIEQRLEELRSEFEAGQTWLADLEARQTQVRSSLLRISGAIQVLEEMLNQESLLERSVDTAAAV
jgi:predicted nuclease with TOPRIM domain